MRYPPDAPIRAVPNVWTPRSRALCKGRRLLLACLAVLSFDAGAQGVSLSGGSNSGQGVVLVEPRAVAENATSSFAITVRRMIESRDEDTVDPARSERVDAVAERVQDEFASAVKQRIEMLRGDGLLTAGEVRDSLSELRENYLDELRQALEAIRGGHPLPPSARDYPDGSDYALALAKYTLLERNSALEWLRLAAALAVGISLAWFGNVGLGRLADLVGKGGHHWQVDLLNSLTGPVYLMAIVLGIYVGLTWIWIPGIAHLPLNRAMYVSLVLASFWFLWNTAWGVASAIAWLIRKSYTREVSRHARVVVARVIKIVLLIAMVLILVNVILRSDLTGLLAGLGVVGLALSFVLKGTIENIAASFTIFGDRPFRVGDLILYKEQWGHVEDIGFRATRFRTFDGHLVNIPNSELIKEALQNVGERPYIRRRFRISLTYDTPPEKVREAVEILRDILEDHRGQPVDSPPHVVFESYGAHDLRLLVQYFYTPPDYWEALEFDTEVNLEILERFNDAGIDFAFPTRTQHLVTDGELALRLRREDAEEEVVGRDADRKGKKEKDHSGDSD